ncbi:MAG TPA: vitamin B12-dependent ribonucleotide reductase, partial [Bryobacteraceae bacterium]|nr:vitamin B12-dependent ribonucleotide reductase [Bryobacteraceae bacterium]
MSANTQLLTTKEKLTKTKTGVAFPRYFTAKLEPGKTPYDEIQWETRTASIGNDKGATIFEQRDVEVPVDWSQTATNIVASKYFYGKLGSPERETSVAQLIQRVVDSITDWGLKGGYFRTPEDGENFRAELAHLTLTQKACFNSPVWFNVGVKETRGYGWIFDEKAGSIQKLESGVMRPQCSACFIVSVKDSLESILDLAKTEGMLFKWGSGTGSNLSTIREEDAVLSGGGRASGPLSFMKGFDAFAGVIKSGGKTRRAAKMVILNADHPDVEKFIWSKAKEEKKAYTLVEAGYDASLDGEAYSSIFFQNANNSVRATDEFMRAAVEDSDWWTKSVTSGQPVKRYKARDLLRAISEATHQCGDPGMQFDTTVNKWHPCKNTARINASNPCSEYMFLDDSACNLSSLNLMKFVGPGGQFDVEAFRHAVDTMIMAQEIIVDNASYPTQRIGENSHNFRPLGLGFANLGALLMSLGIPYDSEQGRDYAGAITAVMCGQAYLTSARISEAIGPFPGYAVNQQPFLEVIRMHRDSVNQINSRNVSTDLFQGAIYCWDEALELGRRAGYRNAQVTVIAPTGTIGFMMDCDTTGIEPDLALVKYKKLVGGGMIKIVNNTVPAALFKLGYKNDDVNAIVSYIDATGTIEGAPGIKPEHLAVFDCSFKPAKGTRSIHYMGHIKMMAATQPFLSGAISKTVNLPHEATVEDVAEAYAESWRQGIKAVAIYRDGSKGTQPLNTSIDTKKEPSALDAVAGRVLTQLATGQTASEADVKALEAKASEKAEVTAKQLAGAAKAFQNAMDAIAAAASTPLVKTVPAPVEQQDLNAPPKAVRHRLQEERASITHKFSIAGHEGYITVGLYANGQPGEIFIKMAKEGSTVSGLMDAFATSVSLALQHGVPLKVLCEKFAHTRFEPSGWTGNEQIGYAKSLMDYIFRWLSLRFLSGTQLTLFAGLAPQAPQLAAPPSMMPETEAEEDAVASQE